MPRLGSSLPRPTNHQGGRISPPAKMGRILRTLLCSAALLTAGVGGVACAPPTPAQKAGDAVRELNLGARWGKMEEAARRSSRSNRESFRKNRENWHSKLRIVDSELTSLDMVDATHANVQIEVSWNFVDDPTLRTTQLKQIWSDAEGRWLMQSEECVGGDEGLFGEEVERVEKTRDKHFPTRVIHSSTY